MSKYRADILGPDDGADPASVQVGAKFRLGPDISWLIADGRGKSVRKPIRVHPIIDAGQSRFIFRSASAQLFA